MRTGNPIGDVGIGTRSTGDEIDVDGIHLGWYDRWLRGIDNGIDDELPARIFVMGANRWRTAATWPLPATDWQAWYLHSRGHANSLSGDGGLTREDVLVYTSPELDQPVDVTGPITVVLYAASTAADTDFTAKLVDVAPCGFARMQSSCTTST
jgi:predicted acyl esterase